MVPADIVPKELKEDLIDDKIKKDIKLKKEKPVASYISTRKTASTATQTAGTDISTKMKGIKKI